mgnify:CR=1 FL=1
MVVEDAVSTVEVIIRLVGLFALLLVRRFGVRIGSPAYCRTGFPVRRRMGLPVRRHPVQAVGLESHLPKYHCRLPERRSVHTANCRHCSPYIRLVGRLAFRRTVQLGCCFACGIVSPDILFAVLLERPNVIGLLFRHTGLLSRRFAGIPEIII